MLFELLTFSIPGLVQFMNTTENKKLASRRAHLFYAQTVMRLAKHSRHSFSITWKIVRHIMAKLPVELSERMSIVLCVDEFMYQLNT